MLSTEEQSYLRLIAVQNHEQERLLAIVSLE